MLVKDLVAKWEWEGDNYIITEISSEDLPTPKLIQLHMNVKKAYSEFWEEFHKERESLNE